MCKNDCKCVQLKNETHKNIEELSHITYLMLLNNLLKRIIQLPAKLFDVSGIALIVTSVFLWYGKINPTIWLAVLVIELFGIKGIKLIIKTIKAWKGNE